MSFASNVPSPRGYAERTPTKPPEWHELVVLDVLFNNLTTGLFLMAALGELLAPKVLRDVATWAYPLALVLLLCDLVFLVLDLGDPLRFHHMLRVFKLSSPMSLGTWCLTIYSLFLTAIVGIECGAAIDLFPAGSLAGWLRTIALVGGLPFAFGSAAYKGVLFSTTAQPGWREARWLGGYLVNSAVMLGAGELLLLALATGEVQAIPLLRSILGLLIPFNLVALALLVANVYPLLSRLYSRQARLQASVFLALTAAFIPLVLLVLSDSAFASTGAVVSLLLASFVIRHTLIRLPHLASSTNCS
jgi:hypothetical protein